MKKQYIILLIFIVSFSVSLFAGSFPTPKKNSEDSLVLIVVKNTTDSRPDRKQTFILEGPVKKVIKPTKDTWTVQYLRLPPGDYSGTLQNTTGNETIDITISPNSIHLLSYGLSTYVTEDGTIQSKIELINEEDRQKAADDLADHLDFTLWAGRDFHGFGSIKPTIESKHNKHELALSSEPDGAEIFLDDIYIGKTPMTFFIDESKHQLLLQLDSYEQNTQYVSLQRSAEIEVVLKQNESNTITAKTNYKTLVAPFYALNNEDDEMAELLGDTLLPVLKEDERLEIITRNIRWKEYGGLIQPDFSIPELSDIDLIATGTYTRNENILTVVAYLYDVRSETIKASTTWSGSIGLNIFEAVDDISLAFLEEVDKVLPDAGKVLMQRNHIMYTGMSSLDARMERNRQIDLRAENQHSFSLLTGISATMLTIYTDNPLTSSNTYFKFPNTGPASPLVLDYEYRVSKYLSFGLAGELSSYKAAENQEIGDAGNVKCYGPDVYSLVPSFKLVVRGLKSDLVLGLGPSFTYLTEGTHSWIDEFDQIWEDSIDPIIIIGARWTTGFRIYLNKRSSARPVFIYSGSSLGVPQLHYELNGNNTGSTSMQIGMYLGAGLML